MLGIDFLYYCFHRISHKVNCLWASHQVHHSSEEFNLTTSLRQSVFHKWFSLVCYLPMALFVPPTVFYTHIQLSTLYQLWIHTETIKRLGPLEYFLNTPSHHRVHHGRNRYCIDKNFAGVFIIWDRIFNTFLAEEQEVAYGLCYPIKFWSPLYSQFYEYQKMFQRIGQRNGFKNKLLTALKAPGWNPKTGDFQVEKLPEVKWPVQRYDPTLTLKMNLYSLLHFVFLLVHYYLIISDRTSLTWTVSIVYVVLFVYSLFVIGALYDRRGSALLFELVRCWASLFVLYWTDHPAIRLFANWTTFLYTVYGIFACMWTIVYIYKLALRFIEYIFF